MLVIYKYIKFKCYKFKYYVIYIKRYNNILQIVTINYNIVINVIKFDNIENQVLDKVYFKYFIYS